MLNSFKRIPIASLIGGILYAMGFPHTFFPHLFFLPIIGISFFFYDLDNFKNSKFYFLVFSTLSFSLGYYLVGYYWIPSLLETFGSIYFPLNYILGIIFSLIIAPHYLVYIILFYFSSKLKLITRLSFSERNILYAIVLTILEYFIPQQFPAHIGHSWLQLAPHLSLAPYFGAPIFSFFSFWCALILFTFIKFRKVDFAGLLFFSIFTLINISIPLSNNVGKNEDFLINNIRIVQANIGNNLKIGSEIGDRYALSDVLERYKTLSTKENPTFSPDLTIWPETAYPLLIDSEQLKKDQRLIPKIFHDLIQSTNSEFLTGGYDRSKPTDSKSYQATYNSVFHFGKNQKLKETYHKRKLIPFGEGLPFGLLNPYLSQLIKNISYFKEGDHFTLFKTDNGATFITPICYEVLFSSYIRNYFNAQEDPPDFIVNLTNDSWYGDTSEPYQHLFLVKWRALEFQVPIVRVTNTGISSILYPNGLESERLGINQQAVLDLTIRTPKQKGKTLFQKFGIFGTLIISLILLMIICCFKKFVKKLES